MPIGTTIGTTIGALFGGVGAGIGGSIGAIFDTVFGSQVDKGHWEGGRFIPGDLQNRINTVNSWIINRGLSYTDVDQEKIYDILTSEGVWQDRIKEYLDSVVREKANKSKPVSITETISNISDITESTKQIISTTSGLLPIIIIAGIILIISRR